VICFHIFVDFHDFLHIARTHPAHQRFVLARFRSDRPEIPLHGLVLGDVVVVALQFIGERATLLYKLVVPVHTGIHVAGL
jgi:hypothetical protein